MDNVVLNNEIISNSFKQILSSLSEKEEDVISRRAWLTWTRETLQSIWNSFSPSITRERVRQIEDSWIRKISRIIKTTVLWGIHASAMNFIKLHWWLISSEDLVNNVIKDLNIDWQVNHAMIEMVMQADYDVRKSKQRLGCKIFFYLPSISKDDIDAVHREAVKILKKKKDVMNKNLVYDTILSNLWKEYSITFIDSCLRLFEDLVYWEENLIWLTKRKILNPKTLKDKTIYVLKKKKTPMHFVEISNTITEMLHENVKVNTIHNELIRNPEFVLIWRWIYALKEWWFNPGTVLDVIMEVLKKSWEPMTTEAITKEVLKVRDVKQTTIYMNLQNKDVIERVGRNFYQLKSV